MNCKYKKVILFFFCILLSLFYISGCATVQPTIKELEQKVTGVLEKLKREISERRTEGREETIRRYGIRGLEEELLVESPIITPKIVSPGDKIKQELKYILLSPQKEKKFKVSEKIILTNGKDTIEFPEKISEKTQGTFLSVLQFVIPEDLDSGEYKLITTISIEKQKKTVIGNFYVKKEF